MILLESASQEGYALGWEVQEDPLTGKKVIVYEKFTCYQTSSTMASYSDTKASARGTDVEARDLFALTGSRRSDPYRIKKGIAHDRLGLREAASRLSWLE